MKSTRIEEILLIDFNLRSLAKEWARLNIKIPYPFVAVPIWKKILKVFRIFKNEDLHKNVEPLDELEKKIGYYYFDRMPQYSQDIDDLNHPQKEYIRELSHFTQVLHELIFYTKKLNNSIILEKEQGFYYYEPGEDRSNMEMQLAWELLYKKAFLEFIKAV